jgi:16S rRNA (guanine527-N7)-methyltransferase
MISLPHDTWILAIQTEFCKLLIEGAKEIGVLLSHEHAMAFRKYLDELKIWAKHMNLIRRVSEREIIIKDFLDSLTATKHLSQGASIIDLGSGAGFPSIPIKIVRPDLRVILLEATRKKVYFLKNLVRRLGLEDTEVLWSSAKGEMGANSLAPVDFVLSRAFGPLRKFSTIGSRFLKQGGILLAMKGKKGETELGKDLPSLEKMGLELAFLNKLRLPFLGHQRLLIGLRKK